MFVLKKKYNKLRELCDKGQVDILKYAKQVLEANERIRSLESQLSQAKNDLQVLKITKNVPHKTLGETFPKETKTTHGVPTPTTNWEKQDPRKRFIPTTSNQPSQKDPLETIVDKRYKVVGAWKKES